MNEPTTVRGVVAVAERNGRLLLIRRADGIPAGGAWCFPGGAIEVGESAEAALVREMQEELGLTVEPERCVWRWTREDGLLDLEWWTVCAPLAEPQPNPAEVQDWRWVALTDIPQLPDLLPNNLLFLNHYATPGADKVSDAS